MYFVKVLLLLIAGVILTWRTAESYALGVSLTELNQTLVESAQRPVVVSESPVISSAAELFRPWRGTEAAPTEQGAGPTLVLLLGAASEASAVAARHWTTLLDDYAPAEERQLWIVTEQGGTPGTHLQALASRGARFLEVNDPRTFSARTGVRTVPAALLFRGTDLVAMVSGDVTPDDRSRLARYFTSGVEPLPRSPFIADRPGDDILGPAPENISAQGK